MFLLANICRDVLIELMLITFLKGNCRVGHHFSGKPCKCFPYCDTTKEYILSDLFGSEIAIESVQFAAHSIFRH